MRTRVRSFVLKRPALDLVVGRTLVRVDALLRRSHIVTLTDPKSSVIHHRGFMLTFDEANRGTLDSLAVTGEYETETVDCMLELLRPGDFVVDLGANIGILTLVAGQAVGPTGRVFAFEPTPATVRLLRQNIQTNGLADITTIVETAVSAKPGRATFALFEQARANSFALASDVGASLLEVEVTSLDAYFERLGWPKIALVKMDVEGQESNVFRGMTELARRNPAMCVIFEYHSGQLARTQTDGRDLIDAARHAGFDTFEVLFRHRRPLDLPAEMDVLEKLAHRAAFNILARQRLAWSETRNANERSIPA
jgi:FkbM family methyltransferase